MFFLFLNYLLVLNLSLFFSFNPFSYQSSRQSHQPIWHPHIAPGQPRIQRDVRSNGKLSFYPSDLQPLKNNNAHGGPDLPKNQAFWNGRHPVMYNGEKGYCPNPRQHNQESTPGTYSDELSSFCQGHTQGRAIILSILPIRQVHLIAFQILMNPRYNARLEGYRFIGVPLRTR